MKEVVVETRGPNRKVYSITETELEKLRQGLNKPHEKRATNTRFWSNSSSATILTIKK